MTWTQVAGSTIATPLAGAGQLAGPAGNPTLYQGVVRSNGTHGLIKVTNFLSGGTATVTSVDVGLGDIGEYGSFFGEYAWAVDPSDPNHLIAADVGAGQMMVTTNGGASWTSDPRLTAVITSKGQFLFSQTGLFFGNPRNVSQVGPIAFDPTNGKRVLIGTLANGVVASLDGAQTWVSVPNTQQIPAITSFFFDERARDVLVASFGRGLWTVTMPAGGFCGSLQTAACSVAVSGTTTKYTTLQAAINAAPNGATLTVTGRCNEHPTVSGRANLTIQGTAPAAGCAAMGPSMTDLSATVEGLDVVGSTGITVRYLNLVDSPSNGLLVSASAVVPSVTCNCIARSAVDGLAVNAAAVSGATGNLIVSNTSGVDVIAATALGISSNTIQSNRWEGITLLTTAAASITGNLVQDNTVGGVILTTSSGNFVDSNTINGNGDALTNQVTCAASTGNLGSNIPLLCL
jgi:parallel beta-helix repeat protein